jgi:hypothetical protein
MAYGQIICYKRGRCATTAELIAPVIPPPPLVFTNNCSGVRIACIDFFFLPPLLKQWLRPYIEILQRKKKIYKGRRGIKVEETKNK